ncbi:MAG TPA: ATP synthase F1 subunit gamma [Bryobacteraceae bacterium]|nr:ATP synthase F1 subunit gamma [Bryobacteraceae bacterium]
MPSLIDIRRRIRSVKNTQQITKAMKMVSAAKLRRAQERVMAARPYAAMLQRVLANVAAAASGADELAAARLLQPQPEKRVLLILMTSDRGLAGAFNSNLIKAAQRFIVERSGAHIELELLGRKGRDFFRRRDIPISGEMIGLVNKPVYSDAASIARKVSDRVLNDEVDSVYLIYNEFKSVLSQNLTVNRILPVSAPAAEPVDYIYEQPVEQLLESLLPRYVEVQIYSAMIETAAAEHAARMTAMDSATSNASDVIEKLTLYMNRVRQASITREIIEVVSGASALE